MSATSSVRKQQIRFVQLVSIAIALVSILSVLGIVAGNARASGGQSGNPAVCEPGTCCPPGGCKSTCPTPYVIDLAAGVPVNSTNATIRYWATASSPLPGGTANVYWGTTTSYGITAATGQAFVTELSPTSDFINFLQPSTKYYYEITATGTCTDSKGTHTYTGTLTGSWSTGTTDAMTTLSGVVSDSTGAVFSNGLVEAFCMNLPSGAETVVSEGVTSSSGYYSIAVPGYDTSNGDYQCTGGSYPIKVQFFNQQTIYYVGSTAYESNQWTGHWNETVFIFAPQVVNFVVPLNYISPYFPVYLDFSNAAAGYSTIGFEAGTSSSFTTTLGYSWSIGTGTGLGMSGSSSTSTTYTVQTTTGISQNGGNLDYIIQMETTGDVEFNALAYAWAVPTITLFGAWLNGEPAQQNSNFVQPTVWLAPWNYASNGGYFLTDTTVQKSMDGVYLNDPGFTYSYGVTTESTTSSTGGYAISFNLALTIPGGPSVTGSVGMSWSETSTSGYSDSLTWSAGEPAGGSAVCIDVFGEGGSQSANTATMVSIYTWTPTGTSCPQPTGP